MCHDAQVRTISFSHDGKYIASASEDLKMDIADVSTGSGVHEIQCRSPMNSVAWSTTAPLLAYAGDDREEAPGQGRYSREGIVRVFGF